MMDESINKKRKDLSRIVVFGQDFLKSVNIHASFLKYEHISED